MTQHRRGRLIAIEGIDGCGKSSLAGAIFEILDADHIPALLVSRTTVPELAGGYSGSHLRDLARLIWDYPKDAHTSTLGFWHWSKLLGAWFSALDYALVQPALARGQIVIADSWFYKYAARFSVEIGLAEALDCFAEIASPDRVAWLDIPPEICARRRSSLRTTERGEWTGHSDGVESFINYQRRVRGQFALLAAARDWYTTSSPDISAVIAQRMYSELILDAD